MRVTHKAVIDAVSEYTGITKKEMINQCRKREYVYARHMAMYLMYCLIPSTTIASIGKYFNRDHTSVLHAKAHISDIMYLDEIKGCVTHVTAKLQPHSPQINMLEVTRLKKKINVLKAKLKRAQALSTKMKNLPTFKEIKAA